MDKRLELAEALLDLSRASERVAKLLTTAPIDFTTESITEALTTRDVKIDPGLYHDWPHNEQPERSVPFDDRFVGTTVLEWAMGQDIPIAANWSHARDVDIITNRYFDPRADCTKIIDPGATKARYDVGIAWETLEFSHDPIAIMLMLKKHCKVVYVRFRPWTSRDGAFIGLGRAFYHLATGVPHAVQWTVVRPLAVYDQFIQSVGMQVRERRVNTKQVDPFFKNNPEVLDAICARTWGEVNREQALRIMATDSVDYVLG